MKKIESKNGRRGRPTIFTSQLGEEICLTIAASGRALRTLCAENSHWPNANTICEWRIKFSEFGEAYARAKQQQVEVLVDEILAIADDVSQDCISRDDGNKIIDHQHINRSKLRIDTRKWLAAKLCPRLYGERLQCDSSVGLMGYGNLVNALRELE